MSVGESFGGQIGGSGIDAHGATVAGLQRALSSRLLTSAELTAFYLDRIERLNPDLHAVIAVSPHAPAEARASDRARSGGQPRGPLDGIPVLVKDNIAARGMPATAGSPALAGAESGDAFLVARLRAADLRLAIMFEPMLGVTFTPTRISASEKVNVIPSRSELRIDCRVPPPIM